MRLTCSNGELPSRLPFGNEEGDFELESGGPITRIVALTKPTEALQPPQNAACYGAWYRKLSLNYLSLVAEGADAFREILRLHNFTGVAVDGEANRRHPQSQSEPHFARLTLASGRYLRPRHTRGNRIG